MSDYQVVICVLLAAFVLPYSAAGLIRLWRRSQERRVGVSKRPNIYLDLRNQALNFRRPQGNTFAQNQVNDPWGVVMDWGVSSGTATVVALSDGTASIYYSSGGGSIGGGYARPAIRDAALHAVSISGKFLDHMQRTDDFSLPESGGVTFYILTERGVFKSKAAVNLLSVNKHPLSELGNAMQAIITQYRLLDASSN